MKIKKLILPNTFIIEPKIFYDKRGFLYEIWSQDLYFKNKIKFKIVQVLHSYSKKNTLRGIHFQYPNLQGRLISIINGKIFFCEINAFCKEEIIRFNFICKINQNSFVYL